MRRLPVIFMGCFLASGLLAFPPQDVPEPKIPPSTASYVISRASGPIVVDGRLDERSWAGTDWTDDFVDIEGPAGAVPRFKTRVKMLWDGLRLYIGAYLEEPHIWATLAGRDSVIFKDNDFEVFIDPDGDTHNYFELEINALNTVWDLFLVKPYRDGGPAVDAWDIRGLETAVHLQGTLNDPRDIDEGWTIEIAIPFSVLMEAVPEEAERPEPGDRWRINFSRVEYRTLNASGVYMKEKDGESGRFLPEDNWTWAPQGLVNMHYPEMWGSVQFSGKATGGGGDRLAERPEEAVKWALRKIYYRQRKYFARHGRFAVDLEGLGLRDDPGMNIAGWTPPVKIRTTESLFEAQYTGKSGQSWRIRQDGLVWREDPAERREGERR